MFKRALHVHGESVDSIQHLASICSAHALGTPAHQFQSLRGEDYPSKDMALLSLVHLCLIHIEPNSDQCASEICSSARVQELLHGRRAEIVVAPQVLVVLNDSSHKT